ncbi:hypothetical protein KAK06_00950 [Ideonella sp. 4Y11]|uniref:Uncharacterized protein n=1 Tax=Ideonella aquatica TaxID=2824119 RepID=A0A940YEY9_9BURK|nr:hypothetical protein [Ideonella aquatica]MBQ0957512.1 hypothetical protein [Ideonella aquatica]
MSSLKLVCEVALMAALGRAVLRRLPGVAPGANPFLRLLDWMVQPAERVAGRAMVPALLGLWLLATAAKIGLCLAQGGCR